MKDWAGDFKVLLMLAVDSALRSAVRVAALAKEATTYLKCLSLDKGRGVKSAVVKGFINVCYYLSAAIVMTVMFGAVFFAVIATGLVCFWTHVFDAS